MQIHAVTPYILLLAVLEASCKTAVTLNDVSFATDIPDCLTNENCDSDKVCQNSKCKNPCPEACGPHTQCHVVNHVTLCACSANATGHPFLGCSRAPAVTAQPIQVECQRKEESCSKEFYLSTIIKMNWFQALAYCNAMDLRLATLDSEQEYDTLLTIIRKANVGREDFWLSGSDLGQFGQFLWVSTGKPLTYSNWQVNQPDHYQFGTEQERCVELHVNFDYRMNDCTCSNHNLVVCESVVCGL